jgi:mannose-6-phosphate isomerase-like protein (cupin superfamily)
MKAIQLIVIMSILAAPQAARAQSGPTDAIDITAEQVQAVLQTVPAPAGDQQIRVVDMGTYNLAVGILRRARTTDAPDGSVTGLVHSQITETYYILSGGGTLVTGGTLANPRSFPSDGDIVRILAGPTTSGPIQNGHRRVVKPGDIVIIPAGVPHGWTGVTDHVDYLSVRPDPDRVLPKGYVNPAIRK